MTEQQLQVKCVMWFDQAFPEERQMLHCNDNNSYDQKEGNKKKAMGVKQGVSDLELVIYNGKVIWIELKLPGERQTEEQIRFEIRVTRRGHIYEIIYSFEEFKNLINETYGTSR